MIQILEYKPISQKNQDIIAHAYDFLEREHPATIRQVYYHLVSMNIIANTKKEYKNMGKVLVKARKAGHIPWEWIEDRSRRSLIIPVYSDPNAFLRESVKHYYKDTWANQDRIVVIILEKEALTNIVWGVASFYNVPVFPMKGYGSWSIFQEDIREYVQRYPEKELIVLVLGDFDPSGIDIPRDYEEKMRFFGMNPKIIRVALTKDQVETYHLPSQLAKSTDPRYDGFVEIHGSASVELDALSPSILRDLVRKAILSFLDDDSFMKDCEIEKREKNKLIEVGDALIELM